MDYQKTQTPVYEQTYPPQQQPSHPESYQLQSQPAQPTYQEYGITPVSSPPAAAYNSNEKASYINAQQPQQQYAQQPQQQQQQQQQPQQQPFTTTKSAVANNNNYQTATPLASLGEHAAVVDCPVCGVREMTRIEAVSGGTTHCTAALLCFLCCLGCIPYMFSGMKNVVHRCGSCGVVLAEWRRSGKLDVIATTPAQKAGGTV